VAETAGWIGYMIQQSLDNALARAGEARDVATVITQVEVDPADPALREPTKFIGRALTQERAAELQREGHQVRPDGRGNLRRVVGSPAPISIRELPAIRTLLDAGMMVVACGGGGAPVYRHPTLGWEGVDAVVDKDLAAQRLATQLGADALVMVTDVAQVMLDYGTSHARPVTVMTADEAQHHLEDHQFPDGSMGPKVRAAIAFVRAGGRTAVITNSERTVHSLDPAVSGEAGEAGRAMGTRIVATSDSLDAAS
jgi:carbamate kinase